MVIKSEEMAGQGKQRNSVFKIELNLKKKKFLNNRGRRGLPHPSPTKHVSPEGEHFGWR